MTPPPASAAIDERRLAIVTDGHRDEQVGLALPFHHVELVTPLAGDDATRYDVAFVLVSDDMPAGLVTAAAALAQGSGVAPATLLVGLGARAALASGLRAELAAATQGWRYRRLVAAEPLPVLELVADGDGPGSDVVAIVEAAAAATARAEELAEQLSTAVCTRELAEDDLRRARADIEDREAEVARLTRSSTALGQQLQTAQQQTRDVQAQLAESQRRVTQFGQMKAVRATLKYRAWRRAVVRRVPPRVRRMLRRWR